MKPLNIRSLSLSLFKKPLARKNKKCFKLVVGKSAASLFEKPHSHVEVIFKKKKKRPKQHETPADY